MLPAAARRCSKNLIGDLCCRLHIAVFLKGKLEDQRHVRKHSMDIAPADCAGKIGDLKQLDPFLLLRLGEMHLQELPHLVKSYVIERRANHAADNTDHHAPCGHIEIGDLDHQPDGFRALGFPGRRKQEVADHIEQAPNHARNKRSFFFAHFHCLPPNPISTLRAHNVMAGTSCAALFLIMMFFIVIDSSRFVSPQDTHKTAHAAAAFHPALLWRGDT